MNIIKKPYIIGLIGYGYWGEKIAKHISPQCLVVFDTNPQKQLRAKSHHLLVAKSHHELHTTARAVIVATPEQTHETVIKTALQYKNHVLVEKPLALNTTVVKELAMQASKQNTLLLQANTFLFDKAFKKVLNLIKTQAIGGVVHIDSVRISSRKNLSCDNVVIDLFPHDIYLLSKLFTRKPFSIHTISTTKTANKTTQAIITLKNESATVFVHLGWSNTKKRVLQVAGQEGKIQWEQVSPEKDIVTLWSNKGNESFLFTDKTQTIRLVITDFLAKINRPLQTSHYKDIVDQTDLLEKALAMI